MKKLSDENLAEAIKLRAIYDLNARRLGVTQESIAIALGASGNAAAAHYMGPRAKNPLNIDAAIVFAKLLECNVRDFSPRIADKIETILDFYLGSKHPALKAIVTLIDAMDESQRDHLLRVVETYRPAQ